MPLMLWILLGVLSGAMQPVQTVINTRLSRSTGTPYSGSMFSFLGGTLCLTVAVLLVYGGQTGITDALDGPWWVWIGGFLGVVALTGNILLFPRLGAVQTVVLPITGQILAGLVIDHFGLFGSPQSAMSFTRLLGALVVLAGVLLNVGIRWPVGKKAPAADAAAGETAAASLWGWRLFGIGAGMLFATQSAINGHLGSLMRGPLAAALVSFVVGAAALIVLNIVLRWKPTTTAWMRDPEAAQRAGINRNPWWMWTGGAFGAFIVLMNAVLVPILGTGLAVVLVLLGSMTGSVVVDRVQGRSVAVHQLLGIVVILVGVVLIRFV